MCKVLFFLPVLVLLSMCDDEGDNVLAPDCAAVLCEADFSELFLEVVSSDTNENVFFANIYDESDITVNGNPSMNFEIRNVLEKELLVLSDENWEIGSFEYTLRIGETNEFVLALELARTGGVGCCANRLFLDNLKINDTVQDVSSRPWIFTISVN